MSREARPQGRSGEAAGRFLQVEVQVLVAQLCLTLCDPMDCSPPGSSVHGILQAAILEWAAIPFSRGSSWDPNLGSNLGFLHCRQILYHLNHRGGFLFLAKEKERGPMGEARGAQGARLQGEEAS